MKVAKINGSALVPMQNQPKRSVGRRRGNRKRTVQARSSRRVRVQRVPRMPAMSKAGLNFLKCAFASPDFNTDPGQGIPDLYNGKSLGKKDVLTTPLTFTAGRDTYIVVQPTPGVAYWSFDVPTGTAITSDVVKLKPTLFPDFGSMFGPPDSGGALRSAQVTGFRYASMNVGLYPTSNFMNFSGSISVWRIPVRFSSEMRPVTVATTNATILDLFEPVVTGLEGVGRISNDNYSESFIKGCYTCSTNNSDDFAFTSILESLNSLPARFGTAGPPPSFTQSNMFGSYDLSTITALGPVFLGLGDMDSIVIKVSTPEGAVNSAVLKVWACLEYRVNSNSPLYQYAGNSPDYDPTAIAMYRQVARRIPMAVPCEKNADFWKFISSLIKSIAAAASYVPGPIGLIGAGVSGAIAGLESLTV